VVANANAVIDPYAVMIEPTNADVAHSAVFGSRRLNGLTRAAFFLEEYLLVVRIYFRQGLSVPSGNDARVAE